MLLLFKRLGFQKCTEFNFLLVLLLLDLVGYAILFSEDLRLTLKELDTNSEVPLSIRIPFRRNITLVHGLSYEINCNREGGFGSASNVWFRANNMPVHQAETLDVSHIYTVKINNNDWKLVLNYFNESAVDEYICRGKNSRVALAIALGNPTVIASNPELRLKSGLQAVTRPSLVAFVSGIPQPANITWYFNNHQPLPHEILRTRNELILPRNIQIKIAGIYTCQVTTSAGTSSDDFMVTILIPPSLSHTDGSIRSRTVFTRNGGAQVTLTVNSTGGVPTVTARQVNWSRNSYGVVIGETSEKYILTHSEHLSQFSLTIMSPTINDSGLYYVTISHEAAVTMLKFQLEVLDPPAPPTTLSITSLTPCVIKVNWTLPDSTPIGTSVPAYVIVEVKLTNLTNWMEIGRSVTTSELNVGIVEFLVGNVTLDGTNTITELQVRARSGNDTGNIGLGEYYVETSTFFLYHEDPDPPTGLRLVQSANKMAIMIHWQPPKNVHVCGYGIQSSTDCNITAYQVTCKHILAGNTSVVTVEVSTEVPVASTSVNITRFATLKKGERYNCSVRARDNCQVLSNYGASVEFEVEDELMDGKSSSGIGVIIGTIVLVATTLTLSTTLLTVFLVRQKSQRLSRSPATTCSSFINVSDLTTYQDRSSTMKLSTTDNVSTISNLGEMAPMHDIMTTLALEELCMDPLPLDFGHEEGLPSGGWDQI